jgi:hypothetical protein
MTLFTLNYIVQLDKTNKINWERAGNFKEAFVACAKRLFVVIGHRKTDENYEIMSASKVDSVSDTESGERPKQVHSVVITPTCYSLVPVYKNL